MGFQACVSFLVCTPAIIGVRISAMWTLLLLLIAFHECALSRVLEPNPQNLSHKPAHTEYAEFARWLVHENEWGVLSTISRHLNGSPFGHVVSYSDGPVRESTGRLLFFLTTMDASTQDLAKDSRASLTISEAQLAGGCAQIDPEDPTCSKLTISGTLQPVPREEVKEAERLLFSRHPVMREWPLGHNFKVYELHIETMSLLNFYGGARSITPDDYFEAQPTTMPISW